MREKKQGSRLWEFVDKKLLKDSEAGEEAGFSLRGEPKKWSAFSADSSVFLLLNRSY